MGDFALGIKARVRYTARLNSDRKHYWAAATTCPVAASGASDEEPDPGGR